MITFKSLQRKIEAYARLARQNLSRKDVFERFAFLFVISGLISAAGLFVLAVVTLPAAFVGWIVLTCIGVFTTVTMTYTKACAVGIVTLFIIYIFTGIKK